MLGRSSRLLVTLLVVPALGACSIGDVRRRPPVAPTPSAPTTTAPGPLPASFDEVRQVRVEVPERYDRPYVEFADARDGYALFAACDGKPLAPSCPALLYGTADGGRSWRKLRHPRPSAANQQLYTAPGLLVLLSEPHGWYTSTDGGTTFTHSRSGPPPVWVGAQGRFQVVESTGKVAEWDGRRLRPVPVQPDVPGINTVASRDDQIVVAGLHDGRPFAAISPDGGRRWFRQPVSPPDGEVAVLRAKIDPTGTAWLIGERPDRTSFPALWRQGGPGWTLVHPEDRPEQISSMVPVGGGMVVVTGPDGAGMVAGDRYHRMKWPLTGEHYLMALADGTFYARGPDDVVLASGLFLGPPHWIRVVLDHR
ncbi:beta propeller repeat protein [Micromonospora sagamiensis]|uniref:Exo-alpha-sialidase n=1 Tax=Micromonospora sagamiensis TaxID=47875 RepID=A0A562WNT4_9ACTN|nr:hypothetical protein [Micromonospora sagamiensis]TWJ31949.1 hypothetical protein JD81_05515 [Micromonospora sagamiensis]BCL14997.1 hypothetical protein GCM10017556_27360 [Micromonospora sagamiensis]